MWSVVEMERLGMNPALCWQHLLLVAGSARVSRMKRVKSLTGMERSVMLLRLLQVS